MIAALMCGGRGTRLNTVIETEKPMLKLRGVTMVERVLRALVGFGQFEKIVAISSLNTPKTNVFLRNHYYSSSGLIDVVQTNGISYSKDLSMVVHKFSPSRVFVVSADLPLLNPKIVQDIAVRSMPNFPCVSVVLEKLFVEHIGIEPSITILIGRKEYSHSGITILDSSKVNRDRILEEHYIVMNKKELAVNVNSTRELEMAEALLEYMN
ncbi:MAG TPA: NTP transferase domain-containing protein [Candidatus Bathyarchaeia archaeon]|nr:NTP transferase domain-containing protein [Candidatus Bathyarchaeia archaeon]